MSSMAAHIRECFNDLRKEALDNTPTVEEGEILRLNIINGRFVGFLPQGMAYFGKDGLKVGDVDLCGWTVNIIRGRHGFEIVAFFLTERGDCLYKETFALKGDGGTILLQSEGCPTEYGWVASYRSRRLQAALDELGVDDVRWGNPNHTYDYRDPSCVAALTDGLSCSMPMQGGFRRFTIRNATWVLYDLPLKHGKKSRILVTDLSFSKWRKKVKLDEFVRL